MADPALGRPATYADAGDSTLAIVSPDGYGTNDGAGLLSPDHLPDRWSEDPADPAIYRLGIRLGTDALPSTATYGARPASTSRAAALGPGGSERFGLDRTGELLRIRPVGRTCTASSRRPTSRVPRSQAHPWPIWNVSDRDARHLQARQGRCATRSLAVSTRRRRSSCRSSSVTPSTGDVVHSVEVTLPGWSPEALLDGSAAGASTTRSSSSTEVGTLTAEPPPWPHGSGAGRGGPSWRPAGAITPSRTPSVSGLRRRPRCTSGAPRTVLTGKRLRSPIAARRASSTHASLAPGLTGLVLWVHGGTRPGVGLGLHLTAQPWTKARIDPTSDHRARRAPIRLAHVWLLGAPRSQRTARPGSRSNLPPCRASRACPTRQGSSSWAQRQDGDSLRDMGRPDGDVMTPRLAAIARLIAGLGIASAVIGGCGSPAAEGRDGRSRRHRPVRAASTPGLVADSVARVALR